MSEYENIYIFCDIKNLDVAKLIKTEGLNKIRQYPHLNKIQIIVSDISDCKIVVPDEDYNDEDYKNSLKDQQD